MLTIQLTSLDPGADALEANYLFAPHYDRIIQDTTTVLKPDGSLLLMYVADTLPRFACEQALRAFKHASLLSTGRGAAAGGQYFPVKKNGTTSRTSQARPVPSGTLGYLERDQRNGPCRLTRFSRDHYSIHRAVEPLIAEVDRQFRRYAPERYAIQRAFVDGVSPDFVLPDSAFTTFTVNKSWRTAAHRDDGDYAPGLGVMLAIEGRRYYGGELIFPKYRLAVDMRTGGMLLADVHELHGNAPIVPVSGQRFDRLSFVFYARERMQECKTVAEELARVQEDEGE